MRYLITFAFVLLSYLSYGQKVGAQVLAFQGNVTTTVRNSLDVPAGEYWMIYNTTTLQLEVAGSDDVWTALAAGTDDQTAAEVPFTPYSTIASTNTQAAIQELLDESAGTDDQTAAEVSIADAGAIITATDVEGALQENRTAINLNTAKVSSVFSGSIADTQVAFGTGANAIGGDADLTYDATANNLTAGGFKGRRSIYTTSGASTDEWLILISNEENPEMTFYMFDGGYPGGTITETYSLHVGLQTDPADLIDLAFLQAGLDDLAGVIDASLFSGNLATTDDTLQEIADAVDGLSTGAADNLGDHTATQALSMGGFAINNVDDILPTGAPDIGSAAADFFHMYSQRYIISGGETFKDWRLDRNIADNDLYIAIETAAGAGTYSSAYKFNESGTATDPTDIVDKADLDAAVAAGGSGDHSLSVENQAIATAVARTVNTEGTGTLSFNQVGTELMRVGNNNDDAVYVRALEAIPGGTGTIGIVSPLSYDNATSGLTATDIKAAIDELAAGGGANIAGTIAGRTGTDITAGMIQTQAQYDADGAPSTGEFVLISDAKPAKVVTTATIAMDGWKMYDDQTADAATITLSDCHPGETLTVYINRAGAPTLAGTGLTFNQLPNTTAFAAATEMGIYFEVAYNGTTIDYYYFER